MQRIKICAPYIYLACSLLVGQISLTGAEAANDVAGSLVVFNDNGAWSWFEDERAIVDTTANKIVVSSVAVSGGTGGALRNGDIDIASLDISSGVVTRFVLKPVLQADDHNSAAIWQRPDGRYVAMYGTHLGDNLSRWRVTNNPGDISSWTTELSLNNNAAMTYSNLHYLPNDNGGAGRLYNFVRSIGFDPNILVSNDKGNTWSYGGRLLNEGDDTDRPYLRYFSDGNKIHFITTEQHPRDFDNSVYSGYIQDGKLYNTTGVVVDANLFDANAVGVNPVNEPKLTKVFQTGTPVGGVPMRNAWTVDVAIDGGGNPVAVFQAHPLNVWTDHRFFYGRWNGTQWQVNPLGYAGSYLYSAENDYTGLVSIDPTNTNVVYLSSEVHPVTKTQLIGADGLRHYELFKGVTNDGGASWNWSPITFNSTVHNVRPLVPKWDANNTALLWMRGSYTTYTNYNMDAVGLVNPEIPNPVSALAVDFGSTGQLVQNGYQAFTRAADPAGEEQSESYTSPYAIGGGQLSVTLSGGNVQFADRGDDVTGPVGDVAEDFAFLNGDMTLTLGNLSAGMYQMVFYSHDRNSNELTSNILMNNVPLGVLNPTTGADPSIGVSSSRVQFSTRGLSDVVLTLDGPSGAGNVILSGFELYFVDETPLPLVDLNNDEDLNLEDFGLYIMGLHANLMGLTSAQAYAKGDLNGDFRNDFTDFRLFQQAYDLWNGENAFATATANVPEPGTVGLLMIGVFVGRWMFAAHASSERAPSHVANSQPVVHQSP